MGQTERRVQLRTGRVVSIAAVGGPLTVGGVVDLVEGFDEGVVSENAVGHSGAGVCLVELESDGALGGAGGLQDGDVVRSCKQREFCMVSLSILSVCDALYRF